MVTIIGFKQGQTEDGKIFHKLQLQGGVEAVQSKGSGKYYMTARTCFIPSTFDEETCKKLIGTIMKGTVEKVVTDPYDYTVPETGEVISLDYQWQYQPVELKSSGDDDFFVPKHMVLG